MSEQQRPPGSGKTITVQAWEIPALILGYCALVLLFMWATGGLS